MHSNTHPNTHTHTHTLAFVTPQDFGEDFPAKPAEAEVWADLSEEEMMAAVVVGLVEPNPFAEALAAGAVALREWRAAQPPGTKDTDQVSDTKE